ncbi:MAG: nitrogen fixation protein FixH [Chromatiaceae bacterium]|nr:MAG: nitrogen fixation protein FixH [Chromatiaceae bacterium]
MNDSVSTAPAPESAWRNPWVRAWIAMILVVFLVNMTMVALAFITNPGLVVADYYERGQQMEQTIATRLAETPQWTMSLDVPADIQAQAPRMLRFFVVDRAGQPVHLEQATFFAYRPSDAHQDFSRPMREEAPGRYAVEVSFPLPGVWDSLIEAHSDGAGHLFDQRIMVARP